MYLMHDHSLIPITTKFAHTWDVKRKGFVNEWNGGSPFERLTLFFEKSCMSVNCQEIDNYSLIIDSFCRM